MELEQLLPLNRRGFGEDWEGVAQREKWLVERKQIFKSLVNILNEAYMAEMSHSRTSVVGVWSVPHATVQLFDLKRTTEKLRYLFYSIEWNTEILQWLASTAFEILPLRLLIFYVRALKYLHYKLPKVFDESGMLDKLDTSRKGISEGLKTWIVTHKPIHSSNTSSTTIPQQQQQQYASSPSSTTPSFSSTPNTTAATPSSTTTSTTTSITTQQNTPIVPPVSIEMKKKVLVVLAPCEFSWDSPHLQQWRNLFEETWDTEAVNVTMSSTDDSVLKKLFHEKLSKLEQAYSGRKLVLVGFGVGVKAVVTAAQHKAVSGLICMAMILQNKSLAMESSIVQKDLQQLEVPVAFLLGTEATKCSTRDLEDARRQMKCHQQTITMQGADDTLRCNLNRKIHLQMTQDSIDRHKMATLNVFIQHYILRETTNFQSHLTRLLHTAKRPPIPTDIPDKLLRLSY
eukprot:m.91139 g.91139  ORF g.91139 m.91139 type:complete len:456 (-) comp8864_c3_seq1:3013-4380(-)